MTRKICVLGILSPINFVVYEVKNNVYELLTGETTTGDPTTVKKKLKMKTKGEKKRKLKGKESPAVGDEDSSIAPTISSSAVEQNSIVLGEEEESQE